MGLTWALIGASDIAATRMVPAIRAAGDRVAVVCSADLQRAEAFASAAGIGRAVDRLDDALGDDVDAVFVSTHNDRHAAGALAAMLAGKHVLCEKPLTMSVSDAVELVATAASLGVVLAVNHPLRLAAAQRLLRSLIRSGDLGELLAMRMSTAGLLAVRHHGWRLDPGAPGSGIVVDLMVHNIDTARFVTGREPTRIAAMGPVPDAGTVTDRVMATIELSGGVLLQTFDGWFVPGNRGSVEVHGSEGTAIALAAVAGTPESLTMRDRSGRATSVPLPDLVDMHTSVIEEFAAAIAGRPTEIATGVDGLRSLTAALAAVESIRLSQIVPVATTW